MRKRRGMLIKNISEKPVTIEMQTRTLTLKPGEETLLTATEVQDAAVRDHLQVRTIAVVRPATPEEDEELQQSSS